MNNANEQINTAVYLTLAKLSLEESIQEISKAINVNKLLTYECLFGIIVLLLARPKEYYLGCLFLLTTLTGLYSRRKQLIDNLSGPSSLISGSEEQLILYGYLTDPSASKEEREVRRCTVRKTLE